MFELDLTETKTLRFNPPVYEQRYSAVLRCLQLDRWSNHIKNVVEFGCAEMKLLVLLKTLRGVERILQIDIDESLLIRNMSRAQPLICDYLREREKELQVDVYCGSIDTPHECLRNTDVVIGVEIIEHLYPETLENVPYNIFDFMEPKIAIFTTPNSECNVLFDMAGKFRHDDHKFEWTREQFEDWGYNICIRFPNYKVAFYGVGPGPTGSEHLGCCSQMAVFVRKDFLELTSKNCNEITDEIMPAYDNGSYSNETRNMERKYVHFNEDVKNDSFVDKINDDLSLANNEMEDLSVQIGTTHIDYKAYRLLRSCLYPRNADDRSQEQKIFDEACFHLGRYMRCDDDYYDYENNIIKVPVENIFKLVYRYTTDISEFRYVMRKNDYEIDANNVFLIKPIESSSESDDEVRFPQGVDAVELLGTAVDYEEEDWDD